MKLKIILYMFFITSISVFSYSHKNGCHHHIEDYMQLCDSVKPTQSKIVFILDGKRVPMDTIIKKMQLNEIEGGEGVADDFPKRAIQLFGEKYRNGLIFFETIKKENNEK